MAPISKHWPARLPFYYGWLIVAIAFVTMAIGVTGRTAFSLLMPPLIDEFKWDRGLAAGAFSFGFLFSAVVSPFVGRVVDARGPRIVIWTGVALMSAGLLLAPYVTSTWQLYATLGVAVSGGANMMTYSVHSQFLPHWFVRRRALAISIAFAGAGVGAVLLLPWLQTIILTGGWRAACVAMGWLVLFGIAPLTFFVKKNPADVGQSPDGDRASSDTTAKRHAAAIIDPAWAATEWTLRRALRTARFWWIAIGYFLALIAWYAVQVHQTKYRWSRPGRSARSASSPFPARFCSGRCRTVSAASGYGPRAVSVLQCHTRRCLAWSIGNRARSSMPWCLRKDFSGMP